MTSEDAEYTCAYCDGPRSEEGVDGSYCSEECSVSHDGQKLLNIIQTAHTHCANCGVRLKEVEKPPKSFLVGKDMHSANSIVGFQYTTPEADTGEIDVKTDVQGRETVATGTVCGECGNTNHSECFPEDQHRHLVEYGHRFLESLEGKRREGVHDKDIEEPVFFETLVKTDDLALALGRSIA